MLKVSKKNLKFLLLYSHLDDSVVRILLQHKKKIPDLAVLNVQTLLQNNSEIFDQISAERTIINWGLPNFQVNENTVIINRVYHVERTWFKDFDPEYVDYAFNEFSAYLTFALSAFKKVYENIGSSNCLLGNNMPLPMLWKKLESLNINTPQFFLGPMKYIPSIWNKDKIIIKSTVYDYYYWRPNLDDQNITPLHLASFALLKPAGIPFLVTQIADLINIKCVDSSIDLVDLDNVQHKDMLDQLKNMAIAIHKKNQHWCSESLFFLNFVTYEITFAMINNYMHAAYANDVDFEHNLLTSVMKLISRG